MGQKITPKVESRGDHEYVLLRFVYPKGGRQHKIFFGPTSESSSWNTAILVGKQIELDILKNDFDESLGRYRPELADKTNKDKIIEFLRQKLEIKYSEPINAVIKHLDRYKADIKTTADAKRFIDTLLTKVQPNSARRYLSVLSSTFPEYFSSIHIKVPERRPPKPFNLDEIHSILEAFKNSKYYNYLYPYVYTAFSLGCRTSELIGLRWQDIDLDKGLVYIYESLARSGSSCKRIRKTTKTSRGRIVKMTPALLNMMRELRQARPEEKEEELIFRSKSGGNISDRDFNRRAWRSCLAEAGIEYVPYVTNPYKTRHTMISHYLEEGSVSPVRLAASTGHSVEVLLKNYAGVINHEGFDDYF